MCISVKDPTFEILHIKIWGGEDNMVFASLAVELVLAKSLPRGEHLFV